MSYSLSSFTLVLIWVFTTEGALYGRYEARCQFISRDGHDAVYLEQYFFNKVLLIQYNSSVGTVTGYTEAAIQFAKDLSRDVKVMSLLKWKTRLCRSKVPQVYDRLLNPVEPYVRVRSVKAASGEHPGLLRCSVYNFYPKQIKVTWLRDGKEITSGVTSTDEQSNGNWSYQICSELEYKPRPGEKLTCMVEHASFKQPKYYDWNPIPDTRVIKYAVGGVGLLLGLILISVAGGMCYTMRSTVHHSPVLLPQAESPFSQS